MQNLSKWDYRFISMAKLVSTWSKDPSRKVGAIISKDKRVISMGFNGFPCGIEDSPSRLFDKATKRDLTIHAELNAILNAKQDLQGCTLYVYTLFSCGDCALPIIQSGISRVVCNIDRPPSKTWEESGEKAKALFNEACIEYIENREYSRGEPDFFDIEGYDR